MGEEVIDYRKGLLIHKGYRAWKAVWGLLVKNTVVVTIGKPLNMHTRCMYDTYV
jgi:hypothetical protein